MQDIFAEGGGDNTTRFYWGINVEDKKKRSDELNAQFAKWLKINRRIDKVLLLIMLMVTLFVGSALLDNLDFLDKGIKGVEYHDFDELLKINPDTVAWLTVDKTHVDHPVVQGKDNFEYLTKGFDGKHYAGGTLFLDYKNKKDFSDRYSIIHGHHMDRGAMFGDLPKFLDKKYFYKHKTGTLLTPTFDYDLKIVGVGKYNAYDDNVYLVGTDRHIPYIIKTAKWRRKMEDMSHNLLALSTCSGAMNDDRIIVFCEVLNKRTHE